MPRPILCTQSPEPVSEFIAQGKRYFTEVIQDLSGRTHAEGALREIERRRAQAQKLEGVAQLTEGIAHDCNNLLVITGNLELLEPRLDRDEQRALLRGRRARPSLAQG